MPGPAFLSNESVALCTVEDADCEFLQEAVCSPEIWKPMDSARPTTLAEVREAVGDESSSSVRLLVVADETPVGLVGFTDLDDTAGVATVNYWVHPDHWGRGYATAAVELLLGYGFDQLRLHKVVAEVVASNEASRRVLETFGFVEEGRQREQTFVDGEYCDCLLYGLLVSEWRER